ncbi:MAG: hypothetical protein IRY91_10185 [Gemmatimonadaceae bacterium]|nr:hypothetical protein [Gemmatimonadaceae bacterium]
MQIAAAHITAERPVPPTTPIPTTPPVPAPVPPYAMPEVHVRPPMVYVEPKWAYKHLGCPIGETLPEDELNALGRDGWELTGVYADATSVHFYFKRIVD